MSIPVTFAVVDVANDPSVVVIGTLPTSTSPVVLPPLLRAIVIDVHFLPINELPDNIFVPIIDELLGELRHVKLVVESETVVSDVEVPY